MCVCVCMGVWTCGRVRAYVCVKERCVCGVWAYVFVGGAGAGAGAGIPVAIEGEPFLGAAAGGSTATASLRFWALSGRPPASGGGSEAIGARLRVGGIGNTTINLSLVRIESPRHTRKHSPFLTLASPSKNRPAPLRKERPIAGKDGLHIQLFRGSSLGCNHRRQREHRQRAPRCGRAPLRRAAGTSRPAQYDNSGYDADAGAGAILALTALSEAAADRVWW